MIVQKSPKLYRYLPQGKQKKISEKDTNGPQRKKVDVPIPRIRWCFLEASQKRVIHNGTSSILQERTDVQQIMPAKAHRALELLSLWEDDQLAFMHARTLTLFQPEYLFVEVLTTGNAAHLSKSCSPLLEPLNPTEQETKAWRISLLRTASVACDMHNELIVNLGQIPATQAHSSHHDIDFKAHGVRSLDCTQA